MVKVGEQYNNWKVIDIVSDKECLCECQCDKKTRKIITIYNLESGRSKSCGCTRHKRSKELTGQYFGDWQVIKMLPNRKCLCRCKCGEEKIQYYSNLEKSGDSYKCRHKGLVGQQFNNWKVLEELGGGKILCQCQCENQTVKELYKKAVVSGETKSCGCLVQKRQLENAKSFIGKQFGEWTVKGIADIDKELYVCECSCEKHTKRIMYKYTLTHGKSRSCGCRQPQHLIQTLNARYGENCSSRINNPREQWQIDTLGNKEKLLSYIQSIGYKPTTKQLADLLDCNVTTLLPKLHQFGLEDYVDICALVSEDELELQNFVKSSCKYKVETNIKNIIPPYELDIYIPEKKLAIEFNGNYWHSTLQKEANYHQKKTIACTKKHIQLIHIFEYEWKNNKESIKDYIFDRINELNTIYARNTTVTELDVAECNDFIKNNHLQGSINSSIRIGLRNDNNELVCVMTLGKPRFTEEYEYELHRLCYTKHTRVIGGAEKLFRYFIIKYKPSSVITYSDISKFTGNIYTKLGFKVIEITKPSYVWVDTNTNNVLSRYQTQKQRLLDLGIGAENQTEDEIMSSHGYLKVYNSGNLKLAWVGQA
jgi:hypothetical protein